MITVSSGRQRKNESVKHSHLISVAILALPLMTTEPAQARGLGKILDTAALASGDISATETAARQLLEPLANL